MARKLLLITAGTVAAGVGREFLKQMKAHPSSELQTIVRYIDIAHLPTRYSGLLGKGEWLQITINPQFMEAVSRNIENYPNLGKMLYPGFLPETTASGGGSVRYNAAGAFVINRDKLKRWLTNSMVDLARSGKGELDISVALVISAVGATGSGTLERLIDLVVDCARDADVSLPVHCDVFILQPGIEGDSDLQLANTFALYAEMAATLLLKAESSWYRGRTIMVGWGSEERMSSIDQLKEAASTLVRLTQDPSTGLATEFQQREMDRHVLRELDRQTSLPSHLSTATAVTISLGDLEEKIIQRDAARLVANLAFKVTTTESAAKDLDTSPNRILGSQADSLFGTVASLLKGDTVEECYEHLIWHLQEGIYLRSLSVNPVQLQDLPPSEQASTLRNMWQLDTIELTKLGQPKVKNKGVLLLRTAIEDMKRARSDYMSKGFSLLRLLNEYQQLQVLLAAILKKAQAYTLPALVDEKTVYQELDTLGRTFWSKPRALRRAIAAIQANLSALASQSANVVAIEILKELERFCAASLRNLEIVSEMNHPLHLPALSTQDEIMRYVDQVSIFPTHATARAESHPNNAENSVQKEDQFVAFRAWLEKEGQLDALFNGDNDLLLDLAQNYVRQRVDEEVQKHSVLDVLLQAGEKTLVQRLSEAAAKSHSFVRFDELFASQSIEVRHVCAYYKDEAQRSSLLKAIELVFGPAYCTLIRSSDPTEIIIFYYVDGLPMSAVTDLTGRCLNAFLKRRLSWYKQVRTSPGRSNELDGLPLQWIGIPVYSGRDAEERVIKTGVVEQVYKVRRQGVESYLPEDIPELNTPPTEGEAS